MQALINFIKQVFGIKAKPDQKASVVGPWDPKKLK